MRAARSVIPSLALMGFLLLAGLGLGCAAPDSQRRANGLLPSLRPIVHQVIRELDSISPERRADLDLVAASITERLHAGKRADLTFICTHNSRRSQMSQVWAQTAAYYYGLSMVAAYSGGTEVTACNCRTVEAMRRVGFLIQSTTAGANPVYLVAYAQDQPPVRAYSKLYNVDSNPRQDFIALMTCSAADRSCPVVEGAVARHAMHYVDPKLCDDTPEESQAYNARCREIAREVFYIMAQVRAKTPH